MQTNDWIIKTKFSWRWVLFKQSIACFVGVTSKIWAKILNKSKIYNVEQLTNLIDNRPKNQPLITCCNHDSCCDDPMVFGASLPMKYFFRNKFRWSLAAKEICFTQPIYSLFFRMGQVLPIIRGNGIYQPIMNQILDELRKGSWLHIFPEGKVNMEKENLRLKWGIGRLIADCDVTPVVLPFYHHGMDDILANYPPYIPKTKQKTTILFGEPIYFDDLVKEMKYKQKTAEEIRKKITDIIQVEFAKLKERSAKLHQKHLTSK